MTRPLPQEAAASPLAQLVARSRRLGRDRRVCNWGGGNTSAKAEETDFRGRRARVLWVKGSGSDLAEEGGYLLLRTPICCTVFEVATTG